MILVLKVCAVEQDMVSFSMCLLFTSAAILCQVVLPVEAHVTALSSDSRLAGAGPTEGIAEAINSSSGITVTCCRRRVERCKSLKTSCM